MDISVVVCTYNQAPSLRLTLEALAAQVTPPDLAWEVVVVDNNSSDATARVVDAFVATARIRVRYLFVGRQGLSHARNTGLAHATGAVVAFTDDDVGPAPEWLASISIAMRESGADIVGGRILPAWDSPPPPWLRGRAFVPGHLAIMEHEAPAVLRAATGMPAIWGANMAFRRDVFDRVGRFDPRFGLVGTRLYRGEEVDLVARALAVGCRAVYDPRLVVWHRIGADRMCVRYLSRLSFQRAEGQARAESAPAGRQLLGAPLYTYRAAARGVASWLRAVAHRRPDTLDRWLECCEAIGLVCGHVKARRARARSRPRERGPDGAGG